MPVLLLATLTGAGYDSRDTPAEHHGSDRTLGWLPVDRHIRRRLPAGDG